MILRFDDIFVPDGDEARRWAEEELSNPRYADATPTWLDLVARDIGRFLADLFTTQNSDSIGPVALIVVCVVIGIALVTVLLIWGRPRAARVVRRPRSDLLGERDDRSAARLRADAERAARAGDWDEATVLRFRAIARSLIERDLIDPAPGATAQAIAREAGSVFPGESTAVGSAASAFDDVRYLGLAATEQSYRRLADTDERLAAHRPELVSA